MNGNTAYPNSNCQPNCQPESDSQKAKDKHNEDMKHADHQKMKDDKNKDSADKKAEKAPGQQV